MTFEIYWGEDFTKQRGWTMFDIEYYQKSTDVPGKYSSELKVLPCAEGLLRFYDHKKDDPEFNKEEFIADCVAIQELRGWFFEVAVYTIKDESHYGERYKHIKKVIDDFVKKYDVYLNID